MLLELLQLLVLDLLEHAVEAILDRVFSATWQVLDDLTPSIADLLAKSKDLQVFLVGEGIPVDFWVQEVVPALSALLAVSRHAQVGIEQIGDLLPLLGALLRDDSEQLVIFSLLPLRLCDRGFVALVPLVLALRVITTWYELCDVLPVNGCKAVALDSSFVRVS